MTRQASSFLIALGLALLLIAAGCTGADENAPAAGLPPWNLTLSGDEERVLDLEEVRALPATECYAFGVSTVGIKYGPFRCRGVLISDLVTLVGGIEPGDRVWIYGEDGYLWVMDDEQVHGEGFITMDPDLREIPSPPLRVVLMYEQDGVPLAYENGGPLRVVIGAESDDIVTEGSSWVKWVDRIEIHRA
jgi:DMSO/TMAO reductase YedYZ molybdopterin-dependent catalytic subunit